MTKLNIATYEALLRPRSVALVGASDSVDKVTARPLQHLRKAGWPGEVYPVNPKRDTVLGEKAWPSVSDLPVTPDHVYVLTGADVAVETARECADAGVKVVSIMADGFVDTHPQGTERTEALKAIMAETATRILGPSSLGVVNLQEDLYLTANAAFAEADLLPGGIFVASQSGSAIGALLSRGVDRGVGFHSFVSTGGEVDISLGEICYWAVDDPLVESFALFMENLESAEDLRRFARAAAEREKPVLVYKLGRSEAGAELALSHTGALAGDEAVARAFFHELGFGRVTYFDGLLEGQHLARSVTLNQTRPPRVCVITTTGGGGAMMVDCLAVAGAVPEPPSPATISQLRDLGVDAGHGALVDLTLAGTRPDVMRDAFDIVLAAPEFDAVVSVIGSSARSQPELAVQPVIDSAGSSTPFCVFLMPSAPRAMALLDAAGISAFTTPEACADALTAIFARQAPSEKYVAELAVDEPGVVLDEVSAYGLLDQLGVQSASHLVVAADEAVPDLWLRAPFAVKILDEEVAHKSDVGGVVLDVVDRAGVEAARTAISDAMAVQAPGFEPGRFLVQEMVSGVGEVLVGYRYDSQVGPIVVLAAGGVLAELHEDRAVRTAPVTLDTARDMIDEVAATRALSGFRGAEKGDLDALAKAIVTMSRLGLDAPWRVIEAEINPLIVLPEGQGVIAVDALVRLTGGDNVMLGTTE